MTKNEIINMAKQAVRQNTILDLDDVVEDDLVMLYFDELEIFAKLVAQHERNEIIEILDASTGYVHMDAIRERGQE
jgi:Ethanolamine utilization protein EutJ (predicted chaperonin)